MVKDYNSEEINKILWDICQNFRHATGINKDYLEYISALLYIIYFKGNTKLWELYERRNKYYIVDEIDDCIESIQNKSLFRNISFKNIKIYTETEDGNILSKTLERLYELVTGLEKQYDTSKKYIAKAYEHVIIQAISNREISLRNGEVYTPTGIAKMMVGITVENNKAEIYDPFCGSGNILLNLPVGDKTLIFGNEESSTLYNLCMTNLFLHDIDNKHIQIRDNEMFRNSKPQFDYIISNPPFIDRKSRSREIYNQKLVGVYGERETGLGDYSYVVNMLNSLSDDGRMAVILPHGVLFRETEYEVRRDLVNKNYIDAIIGLPENMFLGTRNSVIVMVFDKNKVDDNILFIDASNEFESKKSINILNVANQDKIIEAYANREDIKEFSYVASLAEIEKNDFNLTIKKYISKEVKKKKIKRVEIIQNLRKLEKERDALEEDIKDVLEKLDIKDVFIPYKEHSSIDEVDYELLGKRLKDIRMEKRISRESVALALNTTTTFIFRIEQGYSYVRLHTLVKYCNFLGVSIEEVLRNE